MDSDEDYFPIALCETLRCMPELQNLTLSFVLEAVGVPSFSLPPLRESHLTRGWQDASWFPTGLTNLRVLNLSLKYTKNPCEAKRLGDVLRSLAGDSSLASLTIENVRAIRVNYNGNAWLPDVLRRHGGSLTVLRIGQVYPRIEIARTLFASCKRLKTLWIGVNHRLMVCSTFPKPERGSHGSRIDRNVGADVSFREYKVIRFVFGAGYARMEYRRLLYGASPDRWLAPGSQHLSGASLLHLAPATYSPQDR